MASAEDIKSFRNQVTGYIGAIICASLFLYFLVLSPTVLKGTPLIFELKWINSLNINFSFLVDGLSLLFALLITGIGALIMLYSSAYFKKHIQGARIQFVLLCFMFSMLGLVLANDAIQLFIFWELTTITSFILIGTQHSEAKSRQLAVQALLITGAGGLAFLAGLILLGQQANSFAIANLIQIDLINNVFYVPIFLLLVLGCFTKSAQFPFHFWLPNAMAAPTPISAYLHSATMVKAGIYFLARFYPLLAGTPWWFWFLTVAGGITAVWSSILAYRQQDLKLMMAYTTLMALGSITFLLGLGSAALVTAAMVFLLVHALYKAALFLVVGVLEKAAGTRSWLMLGKMGHKMPLTAVAAGLAALSMAGVPPTFGFIAKEIIYQGLVDNPLSENALSVAVFWVAATLMAGIGFFVFAKPFWGKEGETLSVKPLSFAMIAPAFLLAVLGLVLSFCAPMLQTFFLTLSTALTPIETIDFGLWHGINTAFLLSLATLIMGLLLAVFLPSIHYSLIKMIPKSAWTCEKIYDIGLAGFLKLADLVLHFFQSGRQRFYLLITFITLGGLCFITAFYYKLFSELKLQLFWAELKQVTFYQAGLVSLMALSVLVTLLSHSRLLAISALGVMGTCMALIFTLYSAPDVAMTQFMVEILVVILLSMILKRLPKFSGVSHGSKAGQLRDAAVAILVGGMISCILLVVSQYPLDQTLNQYYELNSYAKAHGKNIVNVVLVDFRALDTFGEIIVVGLAGLGCWMLIKFRKHNMEKSQ